MKSNDAGSSSSRQDAGVLIYRPMIFVAVAFISGIALGAGFPGHVLLSGAIFLSAFLGCAVKAIRRRSALMLPLVMFFGLGYLAIQPWLGGRLPAHHVLHFVDQGKWQVRGTVVDQPQTSADRMRFVLDASRLSRAGMEKTVCGKIRVTVRGAWPALGRGDRITLSGHLHAIRNFNNPGGFDYKQHMALKGIHTRLAARGDRIRVLAAGSRFHWRAWLDERRHRLGTIMDQALEHHCHGAASLLKVLTIGDRSAISPDLREKFNRAGVGHVLAISGLHIGMVAAAAFFVTAWLLSRMPFMLQRAWTRKGAALAGFVAVTAYAVMAGLSPSTQRAAIMASIFLLTYWIGRRHDWPNAVALAALTIAVIQPPSVLSISFQLSFVAVLVILAGTHRFKAGRVDSRQGTVWRWSRRVLMFMYVSVLATVGTLPLVMMYFNQVSLVGVAANLLVVPLVGWVVIPLGLAGVLISVISPALAGVCWQGAGYGLDGVLAVVTQVSQWPYAAVRTITPSMLEALLYFGLLGLLLYWKAIPRRKAVLALVLAVATADVGYWVYQRYSCRDLRLTVLDVGQGSANVLRLPGGRTVLVDGGGFSDNAVFDVGRSLVAPYLWRLKIKTVDLVVLSHPNSDHLNGLIYILEHFNVPEVWSNHEPAATQGYRQWQAVIRRHRIDHRPFDQLARYQTRWETVFEILSPESGFLEHRASETWRDENEDSLVLRVCKGDVSFLFSGDIGKKAEMALIHRLGAARLQSTVLLVPHHGSGYSGSKMFLQAVQPDLAVISCGWQNRYRFPHPDVLGRLEKLPCQVWRTDHDGAVRIITDGTGVSVVPTLSR